MIHHISVAAQNPLGVASVLAELWNGKVFNFPHPGSYFVAPFDNYGTAIEVHPLGCAIVPGSGTEPNKIIQTSGSSSFVATHAAISVPATQEQIEKIGRREGWRVLRRDSGPFAVIEFWVENWLMLELLPPELATEYLQFIQPQRVEQVLGQPIQMAQV